MRRGLWSLVVASCLAGCATVDDYRRDASARSLVFDDMASAAKGMKPLANLTQERGVNIMVDYKRSPVVKLEGTNSGFELITVNGKKGQEYDIELTSQCDCLGFRKLILYPISHLLDANGAIVDTAKVSSIGNLGPIKMALKGRFPADGPYALLVAADNTERGKTVRKSTLLVLPYFIPLPMSLKAYPQGVVVIMWNKPKE